MVAMYRFGLVVLAGCSSYGLGVSQTSTVGRVEREAADMTIERRSGEFTLHGRRGPWFAFFDAGLGVFSVRQRSGGQALETDELGLGIREAIGAGYRFERGPLWLTPFASFSGPMVMALVDVEEGGDFEQSELSGGLGVGVEVALARAGAVAVRAAGGRADHRLRRRRAGAVHARRRAVDPGAGGDDRVPGDGERG
jgi:hypothetical protein